MTARLTRLIAVVSLCALIAGVTRADEATTMTFASGEELLEVANTCNFLVSEWARALSDVHDLRRIASYGPTERHGAKIAELDKRLSKYREQLTALREFYIAEFSKKYGDTFTWRAAHGFYMHKDKAGRDLELKVLRTRSRKEPMVRFENELAQIRKEASGLIEEMQRDACKELKFALGPRVNAEQPRRSFDEHGSPTQLVWQLHCGPSNFFAHQWVGAQLHASLDFRPDYQKLTPPESFLALIRDEFMPFGAKGNLRPMFYTLSVWLDPEFQKAAEANPNDYFEATEDGVCQPYRINDRLIRYQFQGLSSTVMSELERQYTAISKIAKNHDDVIQSIMYATEPVHYDFVARKPVGYSDRFRRAMQADLERRFGTIEKLNEAWQSRYGSFAEITLPTQAMMTELNPRDIPLIYEYRKFRKDYFSTVYERIYQAIKKGSSLPIINGTASDYANGINNLQPFNTLRTIKSQDLDCHHHTAEGQTRNDGLWVYHRSVARYLGRKSGTDEYYPTNPELINYKWAYDPQVIFNRILWNLSRDMAQGMVYINAWARLDYPRNEELMRGSFERRSGSTLTDEFWSAVPYLQQRLAAGAHDPLFHSQYHTTGLALLAPFDASMVCHPDGRIAAEGTKLHEFLTDRYWEYDCVPEELILSGDEPLTKYKVLVVPYTLWAQAKLQRKLLDWTALGNTLITVGPFGFWNEYGRENRTFIDEAFGAIPMKPVKQENGYAFEITEQDIQSSGKAKVEYAANGKCRIVSAAHGKGRVYLTDASIEALDAKARLILYGAIAERLTQAAWCKSGKFFLYNRVDTRNKNRLLIAVNKSILEPSTDTILVEGDFDCPVDLTVPGGYPIPIRKAGGFTTISLALAPGEAAFINLGPYQASEQKAVAPMIDPEILKPERRRDITLTVENKGGKAISNIKIQVVGMSKRTRKKAFDHDDLLVNLKGQAVLSVPTGEQYDLVVYDKELNAEYPLTDVDPARSTQYRVVFSLSRDSKK